MTPERLRELAEEWWECCDDIHVDLLAAADEIEALRDLCRRLLAAEVRCDADHNRRLEALKPGDRDLIESIRFTSGGLT